MWKFIKKTIELLFLLPNNPKTKSFNIKLDETIYRAEKARKSILHSSLPKKDRLQIADEILYLINDIRELQTIKLTEEEKIWQLSYLRPPLGFF